MLGKMCSGDKDGMATKTDILSQIMISLPNASRALLHERNGKFNIKKVKMRLDETCGQVCDRAHTCPRLHTPRHNRVTDTETDFNPESLILSSFLSL